MNKVRIPLSKIRSYQTLVYKNGSRTFPKPVYKEYKQELHYEMKKLCKIKPNIPIRALLHFEVSNSVYKGMHEVKSVETDRTVRKYESRAEAVLFAKEHHRIVYTDPVVKYGAVGDNDNIQKPIIDYLEELCIINNDRFIVETIVTKSFGHSEDAVIIELQELELIEQDGIATFKEKIK